MRSLMSSETKLKTKLEASSEVRLQMSSEARWLMRLQLSLEARWDTPPDTCPPLRAPLGTPLAASHTAGQRRPRTRAERQASPRLRFAPPPSPPPPTSRTCSHPRLVRVSNRESASALRGRGRAREDPRS
eukprot:scaffold10046_cov69-Phaeocystis_antarctica.AAC.4